MGETPALAYPQGARIVSAAGCDVAIMEGGQGRPVLMLHGFTLNSWTWRHQWAALIEAGFGPIALDNPGFGESRMPRGFGATAEDYARVHVALLEALGIRVPVPVVGHSLGGGMALYLAWKHPELISKVVAIAPASEPTHAAVRLARVARRAGFAEVAPVFFTRDRLETIVRSAYSPEHQPGERDLRVYLDAIDVRQCFGVAGSYFSESFLLMPRSYGGIRSPVLVVGGDRDPHAPPALASRPAAAIPGAKLETITGTAHCPHEESPHVFNRLMLSFLLD